jgi:hypothetical protein
MANFYWVGGATSTSGSYTNPLGSFSGQTGTANMDWVLAFDWNNPANWREVVNLPSGVAFADATRSPSNGDSAIFGSQYANNEGFGNSGNPIILSTAMAPCLWGGATQAGVTVTWLGGGTGGANYVGTTYNSNLSYIHVENFNDGWTGTNGAPRRKYPFAFLGCPGGIAAAAGGGESDEYSPLYDAQFRGFTLNPSIWGGASWESLVASVLATGGTEKFTAGLRVKTPTFAIDPYLGGLEGGINSGVAGQPKTNRKNWGVIQVFNLKNYAPLGSGSTAAIWVNSVCTARGNQELRIGGWWDSITRIHDSNGQVYGGTNWFAPRSSMLLEGATARFVRTTGFRGGLSTTPTTNISRMEVYPIDNNYYLDIKNLFIRDSVLTDLGSVGLTLGQSTGGDSNLFVSTTNIAGVTPGTGQYYLNGIYIGDVSSTVRANSFEFGNALNVSGISASATYYGLYGYPVNVKFQGNVRLNKATFNKAFITASQETAIPSNSTVQVYEFEMKNNSTLDLSVVSEFNNWKFGEQIGSNIVGGIVFRDEGTSVVRLSEGVVLWNDQIVSNLVGGQGGSKRNGSFTASTPTSVV